MMNIINITLLERRRRRGAVLSKKKEKRMLEGTLTKRPRLLGREKQTPKTGAHGRRKKRCGKENRRTRAQKRKYGI